MATQSQVGQLQKATTASVLDLGAAQRRRLYQELGLLEKGFTLGVLNFAANVLVLGRWPQHFWILHLAEGCVFLPWRFLRFRARNMEWYMLDFCYFVTYFTFIGCILALARTVLGYATPISNWNYEFIRAGFAFANGAMVLAVPVFNNKLVFHDVDNTTSVYIHLSPALLFWTLRWGGGYGTSWIEQSWPGMFDVCMDMQEGDIAVNSILSALWYSGPCTGSVVEFIALPSLCWLLLWAVPYYLLNFCCLRGYLERNEKERLFSLTLSDTQGNGLFVARLPPALQPLGFMAQHFVWTVSWGFASILLWHSFVLHTLLLLSIFLCAVHNGSTYMFRVVAARHVQGMVSEVALGSEAEAKAPPAGACSGACAGSAAPASGAAREQE